MPAHLGSCLPFLREHSDSLKIFLIAALLGVQNRIRHVTLCAHESSALFSRSDLKSNPGTRRKSRELAFCVHPALLDHDLLPRNPRGET